MENGTASGSITIVLIETLWNVKLYMFFLFSVSGIRINRNIVECKDHIDLTAFHHFKVLIETLWNVKYICSSYFTDFHIVLIETLWNVKTSMRNPQFPQV